MILTEEQRGTAAFDLKRCSLCNEYKSLSHFAKNSKRGVQSYCKSCSTKHRREWMHRTKRMTPMECAFDSSAYLGVYIAEKKLIEVFKNAERMPYSNPGYDFICGKGYKIDVKASCRRYRKGRKGEIIIPFWQFNIDKNTIADYFFCIAFNDRTSQKIEHIWLIPGNRINYLKGLYISPSTESQSVWKNYELDVNF